MLAWDQKKGNLISEGGSELSDGDAGGTIRASQLPKALPTWLSAKRNPNCDRRRDLPTRAPNSAAIRAAA
jgi:hypothetical protein